MTSWAMLLPTINSDGDATNEQLSWDEAKDDARRWYDSLNIKRPAPGESLDLRPYADRLPFEGEYRGMVINALSRLMRKRRIDVILPD